MTPKEKALELVNRYKSITSGKTLFVYTTESAKQCALIAVDEILKLRVNIPYWQEVKTEIEKL